MHINYALIPKFIGMGSVHYTFVQNCIAILILGMRMIGDREGCRVIRIVM